MHRRALPRLPPLMTILAAAAGMTCPASARAVDKLVDKILYEHDPKPDGIYRFSEGTTIVLDGKQHLMMLVTAFGHGGHDDSTATILEVHSRDGGLTWTPLDQAKVFQENIGTQNVMSPSLLRLDSGELLCVFTVKHSFDDCGPWLKRSTDNGKTWSKPVRLPYKGYGGVGCDRAVQIATGRIILPCWVSFDRLGSSHAYGLYSDDRGKTWQRTERISTPKGSKGRKTDPAAEEPTVIELEDGRLMMLIRNYLGWIYRSYSTDHGATWSEPENSGIPSPGSMATIRRMPTGDLLLIYNWAPRDKITGPWPRNHLSTLISKDEGKTWSHLRHLDGAPDFPGKITMANVCFVGDDRAVITYSKSLTKKNAYSWRLQVLPIQWFYEGDTDVVYGEPLLKEIRAKKQAAEKLRERARKIALTILADQARQDAHQEHLVASYRFDEPSGPIAVDTSRRGNHGLLGGMSESTPLRMKGRHGGALAFGEKTAPVVVDDHPSLHIPSHRFTVEAWVFPTVQKRHTAVVTKEQLYEVGINQGKLQAAVKTGGTWDWRGGITVPLHKWTHVAVTFDGKALGFFINGKARQRCAWPGQMDTGGGKLHIGWNKGIDGSAFVGLIDEVRIWDTVRYRQPADAAGESAQPRKVGAAHQLFLDDALIASMDNVERVVHQPRKHPDNPVLTYTEPWEGNCVLTWGSVLWDDQAQRFRMWYQTYIKYGKPGERTKICYATSKDGLTWHKPELGLHPFRGSKANNIVMTPLEDSPHIDCPTVLRDPNGGYRMFWHEKRMHIWTATSPDGIHWRRHPERVVHGGDRNTASYDPERKRYRVITRIPGRGERTCGLWESPDAVHFEHHGEILAADELDPPKTQLYGMIEFRYHDLYIGFLEPFFIPIRKLNTQLAVSRDGLTWHRACDRQTFLHWGPPGSWDSAWVTPSHNPPIRRGNELLIFYQGRKTLHWAEKPYGHIGGVGLALLRVDGFASIQAMHEEGTVTTCPLLLEGKRLHLNARARPGYVAVEVLDADGKPVPGFDHKACEPMAGLDAIDHTITWTGRDDLSPLAGKTVRLRFHLRGANLYAFWLAD